MGSTPTTAHYNLCFNIILPIVFSSISCNKLHATRSIISYCSVHQDARVIPPRCAICDFVLNARSNHAQNVIYPFRAFTISFNKLHATVIQRMLCGRFLFVVWVFEGNKMMWYSESGPNRT